MGSGAHEMNQNSGGIAKKGYVLVYITASGPEEARSIAKTLVEKRLVACANIVPKIESIYWWKGKIFEEGETLILAKTTRKKMQAVISEAKAIHSYEVPDITVIEILEGHPSYLKWIREETRSD